ncbi:uncharacterized protein K452DRAFT_298157 [Aplosporella prunicola CBS 121167]|uniref:Uncharacterized protein n=1 Tax=Aplosporella prunicola CBS 121167 TaxID=1176127 RepID=A0A6A6BF19_9PEZI|nr:uncharacterized protein K452DRAFT_298157 [Aplosporella prunicola CBS 121167]KAF2142168.1 hypothetical protein K452DRAFT_298157 [Aplosporella prunicola CBS 121167]
MQQGGGRSISDDALFYESDPRWDPRAGMGMEHEDSAYGEGYGYEDDHYTGRGGAVLPAGQEDADELLVRRALERVRNARSRGQQNVSLTTDEIEALTRPRLQQQSDSLLARAFPPARTGSSSSSSARTKKNSRTTKTRSPHSSNSDASPAPPGFLLPGTGSYAPLGYSSSPSRPGSGSRSASTSISSSRAEHDYDMPGAFSRHSSLSAADSAELLTPADVFAYQVGGAQHRRGGSGPRGDADVAYAAVPRRVPVPASSSGSAAAAVRPPTTGSGSGYSDPVLRHASPRYRFDRDRDRELEVEVEYEWGSDSGGDSEGFAYGSGSGTGSGARARQGGGGGVRVGSAAWTGGVAGRIRELEGAGADDEVVVVTAGGSGSRDRSGGKSAKGKHQHHHHRRRRK